MQIEQITIDVIQATDLKPFTHEESGKRLLHFHFFVWSESGWQFRWVEESTDIEWLKTKIAEGNIYVFKD